MEKLQALSEAIFEKSPWTNGHSVRVMNYALAIGNELRLSNATLETLRVSGLLHDIGKIDTCASVLEKKGKLTAEEFELVKLHPVTGAEIIQKTERLSSVARVVRHHHERFDGFGYPDGLIGANIPLLSRVLLVADAFDSMTADRPYRMAPGKPYAISELRRCSGSQFDPNVVTAFMDILNTFPLY